MTTTPKPDVLVELDALINEAELKVVTVSVKELQSIRTKLAALVETCDGVRRSYRVMHDDRQQEVACVDLGKLDAMIAALREIGR